MSPVIVLKFHKLVFGALLGLAAVALAAPTHSRSDIGDEPIRTVTRVFYRVEKSAKMDWMFRDRGQDWRRVEVEKLKPAPDQTFWLKLILPEGDWKEPGLFVIAPVPELEVYRVDRPSQTIRMLYKARDHRYEKVYPRTNLRIHMLQLGHVARGQVVYLRIPASRFFYVQPWRPIKIGDQAGFIGSVVRNDINDAIVAFILMFIGICLLTFLAVDAKKYQPFAGIGLYAFFNGCNFFFLLPMMQLILDQPQIRYYGEAVTYHLILIGALLFVGTISKADISFRQIKPVYKIMMALFVLHGAAMLILDLLGALPIWTTYRWISLIIVITALFLMATVIRIGHNAKMDIKVILGSGICCALFGVHDVVGGMSGFFLLGRPISVWGMLVFVIALILFVEKRFIDISRELTELNRTLEGRVKQRTNELENVNHELGKLNRDLKTTLRNTQETQLQLVQSEKMAMLGQLIAGIAHEINTPLGSIRSNMELERVLLHRLDPGEEEAVSAFSQESAGMNRINETAISRIVELVKGLKNFARLDEAESKVADLHEGLESTLLIVGHQLKGIEVVKEFGNIPPIMCFPQQINQVFLNLIVNAIQAMDGKGRIIIRTASDGDKVYIRIIDNGPGIPLENLTKIFCSGFTTKATGTGLGLMISHEIVEKHKGRIDVKSQPGSGSEFTVELPIR